MLVKTSRYFFCTVYNAHIISHRSQLSYFYRIGFLSYECLVFWCSINSPGLGVAAESCRQVYISTQFVENSPLFTHKWAIILLFGYKLSYIGYSKPASLLFLHKIVYIILFLNRQLGMWRHSRRYIIDKPRLRAQNNTCSQPNYSWKQRYWSEITPRVFVFRVWTLISSDLNLLITSPRTWIVHHSCWCCVQGATL